MDKKFKNGRIGVYEEKVGCIMENFDIGKQPKKPQKEELSMSVSPICERDGKKIAFVSFSDGTRTAEGEIPECKITKNEGFDEGEVLQLELYMKSELANLKKMASSVNVMGAFMGKNSDKRGD